MDKIHAQLLKEVNEAYPDGMISQYVDLETGQEIAGASGDTLALHIARECEDTWEEARIKINDARDDVARRLEKAIDELQGVINHLSKKNLDDMLKVKK